MTTLNDLRGHVVADAKELISIIGIYTPLVHTLSPDLKEVPPERREVAIFLRGHLGRQIVLIVTRLHAHKPRRESTGDTASIPTVLMLARESALTADSIRGYLDRLSKIRADAAAKGVDWEHIKTFRHAEIAHSLHRASVESDSTLQSYPILDLAHDTYELVLDIETALGKHPDELDSWFHTWIDRGQAFWGEAA